MSTILRASAGGGGGGGVLRRPCAAAAFGLLRRSRHQQLQPQPQARLQQQRRAASADADEEDEAGSPTRRGIEEFVGAHVLEHGFTQPPPNPGRSWTSEELQGKSYEDLRRVWFTCLKERNQLMSIELHYQMQEETLGEFPHPDRLDRVAVTMRRVSETLENRHDVANKVAWREFLKRVEGERYTYPPGPAPPAGYRVEERKVVAYSQVRQIDEDEDVATAEYDEGEDQVFLRLQARFELVLNLPVADVEERLTAEGERRASRLAFVRQRLALVSRNLLPRRDDLVSGWQAEVAALARSGPYEYVVTLRSAEDAEAVLQRAVEEEDEIALFGVAERRAGGADEEVEEAEVGGTGRSVTGGLVGAPRHEDFKDDEHLLFEPAALLPKSPRNHLYEHVMAREEWTQRAETRIAPQKPQPFEKPPSAVDPWTGVRRSHEQHATTKQYEFDGTTRTQYVDAPHPGTKIINRLSAPGEPVT
eukprot:Rhum_TRINITY_DN16989_c0_g1::Rhum_TRINITY_DN16989_c0_g1_i1::g.164966::m.164966